MAQVHLGPIRYDRVRAAFEARVDVRRGDATFRYPCRIFGPETMDRDLIGASLARAALAMSDTSAWPDEEATRP